jgi:hypothetical protein
MQLKKGTLVPGKEKKSRLSTAIFHFSNLATLETTIFLPHLVSKAKDFKLHTAAGAQSSRLGAHSSRLGANPLALVHNHES